MTEGQKQIPGKLPRGLVQGKVNKERKEGRKCEAIKKGQVTPWGNQKKKGKRGKNATGIEERRS